MDTQIDIQTLEKIIERGQRKRQQVQEARQRAKQEEVKKPSQKWKIQFRRNGGTKGGERKYWRQSRAEIRKGESLKKMWERREKEGWGKGEQKVKKDIVIMSHNIRGGLGTRTKEDELNQFLEKERPDVMMIQEAKTRKGDLDRLTLPAEYERYSADYQDREKQRQRGVVTVIKKTLAGRVLEKDIIKDEEGRLLVIPIQTLAKGQKMWLINVYAPATEEGTQRRPEEGRVADEEEDRASQEKVKEKEKFYKQCRATLQKQMLPKASAQDVIIAGMDANAIMNPMKWEEIAEKDRNGRTNKAQEKAWY